MTAPATSRSISSTSTVFPSPISTPDAVRAATREMLATVEGQDGVVANLGHGVIVGTPPDNVAAFVNEVQGR